MTRNTALLHRLRLLPALLLSSAALFAAACSAPRRALPVGPAVSAPIPGLEAKLAELGKRLEAERIGQHVPGMAIGIVHGDQLIWARGFGYADLDAKKPATPETLFAIGSTTKAFTAALAAMEVEEGKLAWDEPVEKWLPGFRLQLETDQPSDRATVRDLLSHRCGFARMGILWAAGTVDRTTVLETATKAEPFGPFRKSFHYNNVMVMAAGEAAARAAGTSWERLLRERLLIPLRMDATNVSKQAAESDPRLAAGYEWDPDAEEFVRQEMRDLHAIAPAGAINSNVRDMAHWLRFLLARGRFEGRRLLSEAQLQECWTPAISTGPANAYGMGWFLGDWRGRPEVEHGGNIDGYAAEVALLPEEDLGFVLLTNVTSTLLQRTSREIVWDTLLGTGAAEEQATGEPVPTTPKDEPEDVLGTYVANFAAFHGELFTVKMQNGRLAVDVPGQMVFELLPENEEGKHAFALAPDQIQVSFERDDDGEVYLMKMYQAGLTFELPREGVTLPPDGTEEDFAPYLGTYRDPAIGDVFPVIVQDGRLACDYPKQMIYDLRLPDDEGIWRFRVSDELGLEFNRDDDGKVESITFHERGTTRVCPRVEEGAVTLPTAEDIVRLRRGREQAARLAELGELTLEGRSRFASAGIEGTHRITFRADGSFDEENHFEPFGWATSHYDGTSGWTDSVFDGRKDLTGRLLTQLALSSPGVLFGDWTRTFDAIDVVRKSVSEGRTRWIVRLVKGDLPPWTVTVDAETGDILRVDSEVITPPLGTLPQRTTFDHYRDVQGLRLPLRITTENDANGRVIVEF